MKHPGRMLGEVLAHLGAKPNTIKYPFEPAVVQAGLRGKIKFFAEKCIGCKICVKQVPEVFAVSDNLAVVDYTKTGVSCDAAIEKCPTKCIVRL